MKTDVLVDTSVWIDYFNKQESKAGKTVEKLLLEERAVCCGIILAELLQGAGTGKELSALLESMAALPFLESTRQTWIQAGCMSFSLRKKGITIPMTDLIIASLALENKCPIFTSDPHFFKIPGVQIFK